jgi:uncharacterized protein YjdB
MKLKKILAVSLSTLMLVSTVFTISVSALQDSLIDKSKTACLNIYKYEMDDTTQPTTEATQPTTTTSKKTTITLAKSSASIYVKGTAKINATVKNGKGTTTYSSSNTKVAKVDKNGKVTAIKKGTATITVKNNKVSKTFKVTVKNPKIGNDLVVLSLQKGNKTTTLKIIGQIGKATFTSSNNKVATVNSSGKITAKKVGKAIITVKTNGVNLKCYMQVVKSNEAPDLEWLSLSD